MRHQEEPSWREPPKDSREAAKHQPLERNRWICLGTSTLQIDRIRERGLINQGRLSLNCVFAERRGNTGRDNARYETNTRGDPAHSNQGISRSLGTFSYGTQN